MNEAPSAAELEAALGALLPSGVAVVVWSPELAGDELSPSEREAIARAVPKRREEFARGRACAREALQRAGHGAEGATRTTGAPPVTEDSGLVEIPVGASREPVWPAGFTGSITHCDGLVAAVAARSGTVRGIGLDAEVDRPLPEGVSDQVITPGEAALMAGTPSASRDALVRFSAKEAVHKAVFPLTGVWLDFLDVAVELEGGAFRVRAAREPARRLPEVEALVGRYVRVGGVVVTVGWVPSL